MSILVASSGPQRSLGFPCMVVQKGNGWQRGLDLENQYGGNTLLTVSCALSVLLLTLFIGTYLFRQCLRGHVASKNTICRIHQAYKPTKRWHNVLGSSCLDAYCVLYV